ncbi:MAG TPA: hypothetical protein VIJ57_10130 [Hanamia sp.]
MSLHTVECKYYAWLSTKGEKQAIKDGALFAGYIKNVPVGLKHYLTEDSEGKVYVILKMVP